MAEVIREWMEARQGGRRPPNLRALHEHLVEEHRYAGWLHCHNEAYRRFGGVAAVNRIDNLKTGIVAGAGAWGTIHPAYRAYARAVGFHVDACAPGAPQAKGKTEAKVKLSRQLVDTRRRYGALEELQAETDARIERWAKRTICPATGETVQASYERERERLRELPILPEPFDVAVIRPVGRDGLVRFEGREYAVPFSHVGRRVEVRGCAGRVQILAEGQVVQTYARGTRERVLIDPSCYAGEATERVLAPPPLGRMGRRLQEIASLPVEARPLDLYAELVVEGAARDAAFDVGSMLCILSTITAALPRPLGGVADRAVGRAIAETRSIYEEALPLDSGRVQYWRGLRALSELSGVGAQRVRGASETRRVLGERNPWDHPALVARLRQQVRAVAGADAVLPSAHPQTGGKRSWGRDRDRPSRV